MNGLKYITNEHGNTVEVILPIKKYEELIEIKTLYEEKNRILNSIKGSAGEIIRDRRDNHLNQELSDFIDEIETEDYSN